MAELSYGSRLERQEYLKKSISEIAQEMESVMIPFTGYSGNNIVIQEESPTHGKNAKVNLQYRGQASATPVVDGGQIEGTGFDKRMYSGSITMQQIALAIRNWSLWDAETIDSSLMSEHSDSIRELAEIFLRWKDQKLIDTALGLAKGGQTPSHIIDTTAFGWDELEKWATILKTGYGYSQGKPRRVLTPYKAVRKSQNGSEYTENCWILLVDPVMASILRKDTKYQNILAQADYRGENRLISGVVGKLGNFLVVEAPFFEGKQKGDSGAVIDTGTTSADKAGLRLMDVSGKWTGQSGFKYEDTKMTHRMLILGAGALQSVVGMYPKYTLKTFNHEQQSESALVAWWNCQKLRLTAETEDMPTPIADIDNGVIAVEYREANAKATPTRTRRSLDLSEFDNSNGEGKKTRKRRSTNTEAEDSTVDNVYPTQEDE